MKEPTKRDHEIYYIQLNKGISYGHAAVIYDRKIEEQIQKEIKRDRILHCRDLSKLKEICQEYIDFVDNDEEYHEENDYDNYVFEQAMEAIFGKNVWEFINNRHE